MAEPENLRIPTEKGESVKRASRLLASLILVLAACGGADEPADTSTSGPAGNGSTNTTAGNAGVTTTAAPPATSAAPSGNSSDDFCQFVVAYAEDTDLSPIGLSLDEVEDLFTSNADAINQAVQLAPQEIKADVAMFADAYGGFVELLAENNFNFLALGDAALDDPRLAALEEPELEAAGDRIEAYCGIENFIDTAPQPPGGDGGGGGISAGSDLPDDFPSDLVPPGGVVVASVNVAGASSVTFDVEADTDDIIDFYKEALGAPAQETSNPKGALWVTTSADGSLTVVVAEVGPGMLQVNVTAG